MIKRGSTITLHDFRMPVLRSFHPVTTAAGAEDNRRESFFEGKKRGAEAPLKQGVETPCASHRALTAS